MDARYKETQVLRENVSLNDTLRDRFNCFYLLGRIAGKNNDRTVSRLKTSRFAAEVERGHESVAMTSHDLMNGINSILSPG